MTYIRLFTPFYAIGIVCLALGLSPAYGQVFGGNAAEKIPQIQFERNNDYMADLLELQNQIGLIEKMISRQTELNKMAEHLASMGLPFPKPAPDYDLCAQLPGNLVCMEFYPDLYPDYAQTMPPSLMAAFGGMPQMAAPLSANDLANDALNNNYASNEFKWVDITCLNNECRAVVTPDVNDVTKRYTVRVGDQLPNGMVVETISASGGIVTSEASNTSSLKPAPSPNKNNQTTSIN